MKSITHPSNHEQSAWCRIYKILLLLILFAFAPAFGQKSKIPTIIYFKQAKGAELLAAKELQRYLYWLNTFYYARSQTHVGCLLGEMDGIAQQIEKENNLAGNRLKLASHLLDKRKEAAQEWATMVTYLLQTVSTMGELGKVANLEQYSLGSLQLLNKSATIFWRPLGKGAYQSKPLSHVGQNVYNAVLRNGKIRGLSTISK